jgi:hypothetical protein
MTGCVISKVQCTQCTRSVNDAVVKLLCSAHAIVISATQRCRDEQHVFYCVCIYATAESSSPMYKAVAVDNLMQLLTNTVWTMRITAWCTDNVYWYTVVYCTTYKQMFELKDGSGVLVSIFKLRTPAGVGIHGYGIEPHRYAVGSSINVDAVDPTELCSAVLPATATHTAKQTITAVPAAAPAAVLA